MKDVEIEFQLASGVSTLESGFQVGWIRNEGHPIVCIAANDKGECFAMFFHDRTVQAAKNLSRAEQEAIEGIKRLILKWED